MKPEADLVWNVILLTKGDRTSVKLNLSGGDAPGVTTRSIPNTMVKTQAADGTLLETARESRWLPELKESIKLYIELNMFLARRG